MNTQQRGLPTISDVARKISRSVSIRFAWIFGVSSFVLLGMFTAIYTVRQSNAVFEAFHANLSQMLRVSDVLETSRQLDSLVESGLFKGYWLYDGPGLIIGKADTTEPQQFSTVSLQLLDHTPLLITKHQIASGDSHQYNLVLSSPISPWPFVIFVVVTLIATLYFSSYFARKSEGLATALSTPLSAFESFIRTQSAGDWAAEISASEIKYREIDKINQSFKDLQKALGERDVELQRSANASAVARMTAMIAHDLKSPLSVVEQLVGTSDWQSFVRAKPRLAYAHNRMQAMIDALKRSDVEAMINLAPETLDLHTLATEVGSLAEKVGANVRVEGDGRFQLILDKAKVERAVINLLTNAVECGAKDISVRGIVSGTDFTIEVADNGPGVPAELEHCLFESGKTYGKVGGTGWGLAWVQKIARGHGGAALYERRDGRSVFSILLTSVVLANDVADAVSNVMPLVKPNHKIEKRELYLILSDEAVLTKYRAAAASYSGVRTFGAGENIEWERCGAICTDDLNVIDASMERGLPSHFAYGSDSPSHVLRTLIKKMGVLEPA